MGLIAFHNEESENRRQNQRGDSLMKKHLQRILSLLCILAMVIGVISSLAEDDTVQYEFRTVSISWKDGNNYDGLRPESVKVSLAGEELTLEEKNNWTGQVYVPADTGNSWTYEAVEGYTVTVDEGKVTVIKYHHAVAPTINVAAEVVWNDSNNVGGIRPETVTVLLLADGEACGEPRVISAPWKVTWADLPPFKPASDKRIEYTVKQLQTPEGYTSTASGLVVTNTLQLGSLSLNVTIDGAPEGADLSGMTLMINGPDPSMPRTLSWADISSGSYDFGDVLPGAYLVHGSNAADLLEGYIMDTENSQVSDAVMVKADESAALNFKFTYKEPENYEVPEDYDPMGNVKNLVIEILGPDPRMPMTITFADFDAEGKYTLDDLIPGVYTVVERNPEGLVMYYTLSTASTTGAVLQLTANGTATASLFNQYLPAPTPEPDDEFVDIPVTKTWNDSNDRDKNRPESITVRLYADGVEVDNHILTAEENWSYVFVDKPRFQEDHQTEIVYTVNEDEVAMYFTQVLGYNIVNTYTPELTSMSVAKVWMDNDNAQKLRPVSIAMTLYNGKKAVTTVILSEENNWFATVDNLPTVVDGEPAKYSWKEQSVVGYVLTSAVEQNGVMTFTNTIWTQPDTTPPGKPPKTPKPVESIEDYDTPLGVEIIINHVGDCFD